MFDYQAPGGEWRRGEFVISTDKARVDVAAVHGYLARSYWAAGIPVEVVLRCIEHSLVFGLYRDQQQVGFARVISDLASFAYLADVFILEPFQGQGLGTWLVQVIASYLEPLGLRRWMLATRDAHELYRKLGFKELAAPERWMERHFPTVYAGPAAASEEL